jgi:hypothetical protein
VALLLREVKEDVNKWKTSHVHGLGDKAVKMATLPKLVCALRVVPFGITADFFVEIDKVVLNSHHIADME